jgi:hypothetical protein
MLNLMDKLVMSQQEPKLHQIVRRRNESELSP